MLISTLIYVGFMGTSFSSTLMILGLCCLNGLERILEGLNMYLQSKAKPDKVLSELEKLQESIKVEEARIRLEKTLKRESIPIGFSSNSKNLEF